MLAEMGYIAMAVDMYGNGRMGNDPGAAQALGNSFLYASLTMAKKHFDAALGEFKKNPKC
jgi:dienelactone hydrolase